MNTPNSLNVSRRIYDRAAIKRVARKNVLSRFLVLGLKHLSHLLTHKESERMQKLAGPHQYLTRFNIQADLFFPKIS